MHEGIMSRSGPVKKIALACLWLAALAGCNNVPFGYTRIEALVDPDGRTVGFVPFQSGKTKSATPVDGIVLAELAAMQFKAAVPREKSVAPSEMRESLRKGLNEGRWYDLGRETGSELLVVGEILSLHTQYDKLLNAREGTMQLKLRVLDASRFPPRTMATTKGVVLRFPEGREAKFDQKYVGMDDRTFRREVLKHAASYVAGIFYEHLVRKDTVTRFDVTVRKD